MALRYPDIDPVAVWLGPLPLRWYALAYLAGFILGRFYAIYLAARNASEKITKEIIDDFLPWVIGGVILGGRLGYVLFYQLDYYLAEPIEALKIWNGGMSFHGGALGVIIMMILYARHKKLPLLRLSDIVCCSVPVGLFFGRIANFINGELFGRVVTSDVPWAMAFPGGGPLLRHPSQLYEALLEGLLLGGVLAIAAHIKAIYNRPGILSGIFLIGYAAARSVVELFREPDVQLGLLWEHFTMGQLLCVPMVLGGLAAIIYALKKKA